jgi:hypothetical protein
MQYLNYNYVINIQNILDIIRLKVEKFQQVFQEIFRSKFDRYFTIFCYF